MWYKIDIYKLALLILPLPLRKTRLFAFVKVLVCPFTDLVERFNQYRKNVNTRMAVNGQVIYIEKALNDYFLLPNKDIYISDISSLLRTVYLHNSSPTAYFYSENSQKKTYLSNGGENGQLKFIVNVPSYLSDRIQEIKNIVEYNKPAGRIYEIKIYDYE